MNASRLFLNEALRKAYNEKNEHDASMYFESVNSYDALITYIQEKMQEASS